MKKLLDVGCGPGTINNVGLYEKMKEKFEIYGIDFIKENIERIKLRFPLGKFKTGNAQIISYNRNFFDYVIALHVLEHVKDPVKVIREINRVCKKNAFLLIRIPDKKLEDILNKVLSHYVEKGHHHQRIFSEKDITSLLEENGFTLLYVKKQKWPMFIIVLLLALSTRITKKISMEEQSGIFKLGENDYLKNENFYPLYSLIYSLILFINAKVSFLNYFIPFELEILAKKR